MRILTPLLAPLLGAALLAGCTSTAERFAVPAPAAPMERQSIAYRSVELREVSLPTYAASEEIYVRDASGALTSSPSLLWADDPARAMTLEMARLMGQATGARVAPEPWPFRDRAGAIVEVRVEEMQPGTDGSFRLSGQYFVASDSGTRDRSGTFALVQSFDPAGGASAVAAARGAAVRDLTAQIARDGLR